MTSPPSSADIVRSLYDAFRRHDLDAVINALATDFELTTAASLPWSKGTYRGTEEAIDFFSSTGMWLTDARLLVGDIVEAGDRVIVHGREQAIVTATGKSFDALFTHSFTVRDGKIARMRGVVDTGAILMAWPDSR
jgi:uncharacterized protein